MRRQAAAILLVAIGTILTIQGFRLADKYESPTDNPSPTGLMPDASAQAPALPIDVAVNSFTRSRQQEATVAVDANGDLIVVWTSARQERGTAGIFAQRFAAGGARIGGELHINRYQPASQSAPAVACDAAGRAWIAWESDGQDGYGGSIVATVVAFRPDDEKPAVVAPEFLVNELRPGHQSRPSISLRSDGRAMIAWTSLDDVGRSTIFGRVFNDDASPLTGDIPLSQGTSDSHASTAPTDAGFVAVWQRVDDRGHPAGIFARAFDPAGKPRSEAVLVSRHAGTGDIEPTICNVGDENAVVAWMSREDGEASYRVLARRVNFDGRTMPVPLVVADTTSRWNSGAQIVSLPDGGFAVAYNEISREKPTRAVPGRGGSPSLARVRAFDATGSLMLDAKATGDESNSRRLAIAATSPSVAVMPGGQRLALAWSGRTPAGDGSGVGLTLMPMATRASDSIPQFADRIELAERGNAETARLAPPEFDPFFVPEPRDVVAGGVGPDFGFLGIQATGWNPPDPHIAVGLDHVVCVVNSTIAVFTKSGAMTFNQELNGFNGFWGQQGATFFVFDPVALFDPHSERYIVAAAEHGDFGGYFLLLAVSKSGDPGDGWHKYRFNVTSLGSFLDFPNIGVDSQAVYLAADYFDPPTGNYIHIIPKAPVLVGDDVDITPVQTATGPIVLGAVKSYDADAPAQYFATTYSGSDHEIKLIALRDPLGTPIVDTYQLDVSLLEWPPDAEQLGSTNLVDTIDFRIKQGVYRDGSLWLTHNVNASGLAAVRWYEIAMNGWPESGDVPTVLQERPIVPGSGVYTWFADIDVDADGNMAMAFSRSSAEEYVSVARVFQRSCDPTGKLSIPVTVQESSSPEPGDRWGDYSRVQADHFEPGVFWSANEYRTSAWRTWINKLVVQDATLFDGDGSFDLVDAAELFVCFGQEAGVDECERFDMDCSQTIDLSDYAMLSGQLSPPQP